MKINRILLPFFLSFLTLFFFSCGGAPSETTESEEAVEEEIVAADPEVTEPEPESAPEPDPEPTPAPETEAESTTLKIAYSDWPGWVAWEIAIQKNWFEEAGVDVELRNNLWNNVKELNKEGVTIILTTHYLLEAQEMCDRIAIIDKGNLVALDTTQKLLDRIQTKKINFKVKNIDKNKILQMEGIKFKVTSNE